MLDHLTIYDSEVREYITSDNAEKLSIYFARLPYGSKFTFFNLGAVSRDYVSSYIDANHVDFLHELKIITKALKYNINPCISELYVRGEGIVHEIAPF